MSFLLDSSQQRFLQTGGGFFDAALVIVYKLNEDLLTLNEGQTLKLVDVDQ